MIKKPCEKRVAFHEAGHAVAYIVMGIKFGGATIIPDYDEGGNCISLGHTIPHTQPVQVMARDLAVVNFSGSIAEAKYRHCSFFEYMAMSGRADFENACKMVDKSYALVIGSQPRNDLHRKFERDAKAIINTYWIWVNAIAHALLEKKTLTFEEIIEIIEIIKPKNGKNN